MTRSVVNAIPSSSRGHKKSMAASQAKGSYRGADTKTTTLYRNTNDIIKGLQEFSEKLELTSELNTYIETLENSLKDASAKQAEIEAMEYLAWTSDEPVVVEARKKLFFAVKLVHGDFLQEYNKTVKEQIAENLSLDKSSEYEDDEDMVSKATYISERDWDNNQGSFLTWLKRKIWRKARTRKALNK